MASLVLLRNFVRIELPGIPEPLLVDGILKTVQEFFKESEAWRYTADNLLDWSQTAPTFPVITVGVDIPADTRVHRIDEVKYARDGISLRKLRFYTRQQLDRINSNWEVDTGSSPKSWTYDGPGTPRIIPINSEATVTGSVQIRAVIIPDSATTTLPDALFFEFEEDFRNGTLARLMKIPGKDWTNFSGASAYASLFQDGIKKAKSRADADYGQPCREVCYGGL